ncbi:hypothetical protein EMIT0P43_30285 [Pseudomonas jessenii]|uniref:hypothetical protein n=1 Tax=Pseudomonas jessenii TaxID=77298 RepID=UPI0039E178F6
MDGLEVAQVRQLEHQPYTQIHDIVEGLEDVSRFMPRLELGDKGWAWMRMPPVRFSNLSDVTHLDDLKNLIKWRCVELNLHMLSLICRKAEAPYSEKAEATYLFKYDHGSNLVTYRRLKALDIEGLDDQLLLSPEEFADVLLTQLGVLDESAESLSRLLWAIHESSDMGEMDQLFDRTICGFGRLEDVPQPLWAKVLLSERVSMKPEAVWTFFGKVLLAALDKKGCEQMHMDAFAGFIKRHAQQLQKDLWETEVSLHQKLQKYLLASTGIDNKTLEVLFAGRVFDDASILDGSFGLLPKERWEMLATSTFLAFTPEIRQRIQAYDADLDAPYLVAHWRHAREQIDLSQLSLDMVLRLSKSRAPTLDEKINLWAGLPAEDFDTFDACKEAVEEISRICLLANRGSSRFPSSFAPLLRKLATQEWLTSDQCAEMLIQCLPSSSWGETALLLGLLSDEGFTKLSPNVKKIEVPSGDLNMRLLGALQARGFVGTVTPKSESFSATTRPSEMKDVAATQ